MWAARVPHFSVVSRAKTPHELRDVWNAPCSIPAGIRMPGLDEAVGQKHRSFLSLFHGRSGPNESLCRLLHAMCHAF